MSLVSSPKRLVLSGLILLTPIILVAAMLVMVTASPSAHAQGVVAPTCPQGYTLSGYNCVKSAPAPSCPSGYILLGGQCKAVVAVPRPVNLALPLQQELKRIGCLTGRVDGVWGKGSRAALNRFNNQIGTSYGSEPSQHVLDEARKRKNGFCAPVRAAPRPPSQTTPVRKKARCSSIKFAFTKGNTCSCSDNRIFNGYACVRPPQSGGGSQYCSRAGESCRPPRSNNDQTQGGCCPGNHCAFEADSQFRCVRTPRQ